MSGVALGDALPDLPLVTADGTPTSLASFAGEATLLIFLRHLG